MPDPPAARGPAPLGLGAGDCDVEQIDLGRYDLGLWMFGERSVTAPAEPFDFDFQPSIDRKLIYDLASCRFVAEGRPVIFPGQPGTGKSHLASVICAAAVCAGYRVFFTAAADLVANMAAAYADGSFATRLRA